MPTSRRHLQVHATGGRAAVSVAGVALLATMVSGCARPGAGSGAAGQPPRLHLVTGSNTLGRDAAPAVAGVAGFAGFGGYVLVGALPDEPTRAPVRRWSAGPAGTADVQRLAGALGVTGTPVRHAYGWVVTGATGVLRIRDGGGIQWSYTRADRADCPPSSVDVDHAGASGVGCAMAVSPGRPGPAGPSASVTRARAAALLGAMGVSPSQAAAATVYVGSPDSTLSVTPTVDGMPTQGLEISVSVDVTGITGASGRLRPPNVGDVYPLRTAKRAFEELANGPRSLVEPYCGPIPDLPSTAPGGTVAPAPCPSPAPARVTGAQIGLLLTYEASADAPDYGTPVMVPAWFFTVADDGGAPPAVIAIDPSFLAPPGQPQRTGPSDAPGGVPGGGAGGSSGWSGSGGGSAGSAGPNLPSPPDGPPVAVPASPKP